MHSTKALMDAALKQPMLKESEDIQLATAWRDEKDEASLHKLQCAYMRLAISIACNYKRSNFPLEDLIAEAMVGLAKAAEKYDPDRGLRFSTCAMWWIKAALSGYVIRACSVVRIAATNEQKKVFFNYHRQRNKLQREAMLKGELLKDYELCVQVAAALNVSVADVERIQGGIASSKLSLNTKLTADDEGSAEWIDYLEDDSSVTPGAQNDSAYLSSSLVIALSQLKERERYVVTERKLLDEPRTLESLGNELGVSKERVRQIEQFALQRLRTLLQRDAPEVELLLHDS